MTTISIAMTNALMQEQMEMDKLRSDAQVRFESLVAEAEAERTRWSISESRCMKIDMDTRKLNKERKLRMRLAEARAINAAPKKITSQKFGHPSTWSVEKAKIISDMWFETKNWDE
jgi:hypothetical protein